jgi:putative ubiquitin-RnfH superfamily antitoxin RatB of RatAB toxin-antitoxin module
VNALRITVLWSPGPREVREWRGELPEGATVRDAVRATGWELPPLAVGIWGRRVEAEQPLRDEDRVELYRPLLVDPKVARRERFRRQGARNTGLFAQRRPGAKPGY